MTLNKPIRVLHSFGSLGRGGIETWLMNILRLHSDEIKFDFILGKLGEAYEEEARGYGCRIHKAPPIRQLSKNLSFLREVLTNNRYDVYHAHGEEFMGDSVKIAAKAGVPVRIAHCHSTKLARGKKGFEMRIRSLRHKTIDRSRILSHATDILACSSDAGRFLMGRHWGIDPRCRTLYCGIPLEHFSIALSKWSRSEFRNAHGIPNDAIMIGHAGSMGPSPVKNHSFIIEIFAELARRDQRYYLYLAGDGPLRPMLEQKVMEMGLQSRILMPGLCDDIPSLMIHGFDIHILPSLQEGLPVVGMEAVASGLFTICSDTITRDFTEPFSQRVLPVSLEVNASIWADRVEEAVQRRISVEEGIAIIEKSPFSIHNSLSNMLNIYKQRLQTCL
jgi:glycosyltransferase involved in cell wall biosynthesis